MQSKGRLKRSNTAPSAMHVCVCACVDVIDSLHELLLKPWMESTGNYVFGFDTQTRTERFHRVIKDGKSCKGN